MSDHELATNHIDQLEKRLASLHDLGVDTAGLRSQLAFARTQVHEGRIAEALGICEEVADTARRLADGTVPPPERPRTGRFTRDQLAEAVKDLLSQGLLAKLMAEQRSGPDVRLEARLSALDEHLRTYIGREADALRAEQQVLREEMEQVRRALGSLTTAPVSDLRVAKAAPEQPPTEPAWAARLQNILVESISRADAQAAQITSIVQHLAASDAGTENSSGLTARVEALRSSIADDLRALVERSPAPVPTPALGPVVENEPVWAQHLGTTLKVVAERLINQPATASPPAMEPAWAQSLGSALQGVAERLQQAPAPTEAGEPSWAQGLRDALDAVATRLSAQPLTLVAEPSAPQEPAWSVALRDALAGAEARHQELLVTVAARPAQDANDERLGDQLAGAFERGLHDLGAMLAQHHADMGPRPMDESRGALSPVTLPEQKTTSVIANTTTRTDRVATHESISPDLLRKLVEREVETHLGTRNTAAITSKNAGIDDMRALIAAELDVRQGGAVERTGGRSDMADLRSGVLRLLPELLNDDAVRHSLFAVLALEAVSKPGALGELTGLRAFLRRELSRAAE
ncbi:MAG TPA: hypothetical protein VHX44_01450, partial [Planctomycetota bacterium]|nr:hypothetical protein [Planctomycetota bacterium]